MCKKKKVQRKQWKVDDLKVKWAETLTAVQHERHLTAERANSVAALSSVCLRQLEAFSQVSDLFHFHESAFSKSHSSSSNFIFYVLFLFFF